MRQQFNNGPRLEVIYPFYKDFSKYLKRMSLKHMGGVKGATDRVLRTIRDTLLTPQDIEILINFKCQKINEKILQNQHIPQALRYKILIKNHLYTSSPSLLGYREKMGKMGNLVLKHCGEYYAKNPNMIDNEGLFKIYAYVVEDWGNMDEEIITTNLVRAVVHRFLEDSKYTWRYASTKAFIDKLPVEKLIKIIKELLEIDIAKANYTFTTYLLLRVRASKEPVVGHLKSLIQYCRKEILPSIVGDGDNTLGGMLDTLRGLVRDEVVSENEFEEFVQAIRVETDSTNSALIKIIRRLEREREGC